MPMTDKGVATEIPPKTLVRQKGSYHEDVLSIIEDIKNLEPGQFVVREFTDDDGEADPKKASVRASALRKAGYFAQVRGASVYACEAEDEGEDEDDD